MRIDRDLRFEGELARRFQAAAAGSVDLALAFAVDGDVPQRLTAFAVREGTLTFQDDECGALDATFFFDQPQTALDILDGRENPFTAFADSRFRSDGNLPLAFVLLGLFGGEAEQIRHGHMHI